MRNWSFSKNVSSKNVESCELFLNFWLELKFFRILQMFLWKLSTLFCISFVSIQKGKIRKVDKNVN